MWNLAFLLGPEQGGAFGPYVQSSRLDIYKKYAESLVSVLLACK